MMPRVLELKVDRISSHKSVEVWSAKCSEIWCETPSSVSKTLAKEFSDAGDVCNFSVGMKESEGRGARHQD